MVGSDHQFLIECHEVVVQCCPHRADLADWRNVRTDELFCLWEEKTCQQSQTLRGGVWSSDCSRT